MPDNLGISLKLLKVYISCFNINDIILNSVIPSFKPTDHLSFFIIKFHPMKTINLLRSLNNFELITLSLYKSFKKLIHVKLTNFIQYSIAIFTFLRVAIRIKTTE
ncbi:hypothetical protein SAMN03159304_00214 [Pseudomonas sp. NFACC24-1]|nr:hypothetical protein SAMN03159304_00214 [Pseudomonas sp. NFACC24-1]